MCVKWSGHCQFLWIPHPLFVSILFLPMFTCPSHFYRSVGSSEHGDGVGSKSKHRRSRRPPGYRGRRSKRTVLGPSRSRPIAHAQGRGVPGSAHFGRPSAKHTEQKENIWAAQDELLACG
ncbi:hypothetical protein B0T24DRAFT_609349 [Lasiosphaeria ovina]|uniref:Uncharacterized protein n=1 Tax=Lasiosphaeria ovina TaxID=92902 RepID=A0AAE0TZ51_9PEZI|nr:hypothetical protein B0T24DRAFT_609349 [Lasiosphaeria ovina]